MDAAVDVAYRMLDAFDSANASRYLLTFTDIAEA